MDNTTETTELEKSFERLRIASESLIGEMNKPLLNFNALEIDEVARMIIKYKLYKVTPSY